MCRFSSFFLPTMTAPQVSRPGFWQALRTYLEPASLRMLLLGFAAGLPLLLVLGTLSFRLREAGIERSTIGFLSWVALAYGFKWVWAPLVDHVRVPLLTRWLGRRRSWLLLAQGAIVAGLVGMALVNPAQSWTLHWPAGLVAWLPWLGQGLADAQLWLLVGFTLLAAFGSATQDIALDAYRIESAAVEQQAVLAATYQGGYRLAMIWAGAGALWLAQWAEQAGAQGYQQSAWALAYLVMAASMAVGMLVVLFAPEPQRPYSAPTQGAKEWMLNAFVAPFWDFWLRYRAQAVLILALIATYRISDIVMGVMANPFYVDMGFSKNEVALATKIYGPIMTMVGVFLGGWISLRIGVLRVLMLGAVLAACTNLLFAWLSLRGHDFVGLIWVISADNLAAGVASVAFIAYLSSLTNIQYSATQYALFSSMMMLLPKFVGGFSGVAVDSVGYTQFFIGTACLGLPVLLLIHWVEKNQRRAGAV